MAGQITYSCGGYYKRSFHHNQGISKTKSVVCSKEKRQEEGRKEKEVGKSAFSSLPHRPVAHRHSRQLHAAVPLGRVVVADPVFIKDIRMRHIFQYAVREKDTK
jgi:hypothetical protein